MRYSEHPLKTLVEKYAQVERDGGDGNIWEAYRALRKGHHDREQAAEFLHGAEAATTLIGYRFLRLVRLVETYGSRILPSMVEDALVFTEGGIDMGYEEGVKALLGKVKWPKKLVDQRIRGILGELCATKGDAGEVLKNPRVTLGRYVRTPSTKRLRAPSHRT